MSKYLEGMLEHCRSVENIFSAVSVGPTYIYLQGLIVNYQNNQNRWTLQNSMLGRLLILTYWNTRKGSDDSSLHRNK